VWIALFVGELVVLAMVGDPANDRALDGQRAGDRERDPKRSAGLEGAVREVSVEADADAVPGDRVHHRRDHYVVPAEPPAPGDRHCGNQGDERDSDEQEERDLLPAHLAVSAVGGGNRGDVSRFGGAAVLVDQRCGGWCHSIRPFDSVDALVIGGSAD
jgi:hypothetical protein